MKWGKIERRLKGEDFLRPKYQYILIDNSLGCAAEANITLYSNYTLNCFKQEILIDM